MSKTGGFGIAIVSSTFWIVALIIGILIYFVAGRMES
jgi:hypothetical protein